MKQKRFVTIFDRAKNFHLVKDVGQVPYHMHKEHNYDSVLLTCKNEDTYKYLDDEVKGLKLEFISNIKLFKINFSVIFYLMKNAKKIDVLHQFHIRNYTLLYALIYKFFNKNGINYIKADANEKFLEHRGSVIKKKHLNKINKYIDFISFETSNVVDMFKKENPKLSQKAIKIPNGIDEKYITEKLNISDSDCTEKENIIIYVARIGTHQKNTELFLDSIEKIELGDWKVHLIGEIETEFNTYIESFFLRNTHLKDKVIFHGNISSREKIYKYYLKSKIFCMSSRFEGFPLVYPEVLYFGNYIFTTDVSGAKDITKDEKYGTIINDFCSNEYSEKLENLIKTYELKTDFCNEIKDFAKNNYTWQKIIEALDNNIRKER